MEKQSDNWLASPWFLAIAPFAGYALAFAYECGYAVIFGIPFSWIVLSLTDVMLATGILASLFMLLVGLGLIVETIVPVELLSEPARQRIINILPSTLFFVSLLVVCRGHWYAWISVLITIGIVQGITGTKIKASVIRTSAISNFGGAAMRFVATFTSLIVLASDAGFYHAKDKVSFFVHGSEHDCVLLRIYGDMAVSSKYDSSQHKLVGCMVLQKISDSPLFLTKEDIGPLRGN